MPESIKHFRSTANRSIFYGLGGAFVVAPLLGIIYAVTKGPLEWGGSIALCICSTGFLCFCIMFFIDSSEIIVDEAGIARRLFGRACMYTPWTAIKVIRERFFLNQRFGGEIRVDVIPVRLDGIALRFRRTIKFSDQTGNFDELLDLLNEKSEKYSIRLEVASDGIWKRQSKLVARVPYQS